MPVAALHPNPRQPRTRFDETALSELADSIRSNGILQPILVRPRALGGGYEIVAGERRYRAALRVGLTVVPVVVRALSDAETLALALIENLLREDIGPLETARSFRRLIDEFGWTQDALSQRVGKSRPVVANALRLLELPDPIQDSLHNGEISEGHARMLVGDARERHRNDFRERQTRVWHLARDKNITVREVERLMRRSQNGGATAASPNRGTGAAAAPILSPVEVAALEGRLRDALGTRVRIVASSEGRGRIEIDYFSADELDGLLSRLEREGKAPLPARSPAKPSNGPIPAPRSSHHPAR